MNLRVFVLLSLAGFKCFRIYFESVNAHESKIKLAGHNILVEKQDLVGLSYLWQIVLETPYEDIAVDAAQYLMQLCYTFLSPKLKKVHGASFLAFFATHFRSRGSRYSV